MWLSGLKAAELAAFATPSALKIFACAAVVAVGAPQNGGNVKCRWLGDFETNACLQNARSTSAGLEGNEKWTEMD